MECPSYDEDNGTCRNMLPDDVTCGLTRMPCGYRPKYAVMGYVDDNDRPNAEIFAFCDSLEEAREVLDKIHRYDGARGSPEARRLLEELREKHGVVLIANDLGADSGYEPKVDARIVEIKHVTW